MLSAKLKQVDIINNYKICIDKNSSNGDDAVVLYSENMFSVHEEEFRG